MITNQGLWHAATSPVLTVDQGKATANRAVYRNAQSPLAQHKGTTLPIGATAPTGTGALTADFRASGISVQAEVLRMAVVDRDRITDVPGVQPRGAPV